MSNPWLVKKLQLTEKLAYVLRDNGRIKVHMALDLEDSNKTRDMGSSVSKLINILDDPLSALKTWPPSIDYAATPNNAKLIYDALSVDAEYDAGFMFLIRDYINGRISRTEEVTRSMLGGDSVIKISYKNGNSGKDIPAKITLEMLHHLINATAGEWASNVQRREETKVFTRDLKIGTGIREIRVRGTLEDKIVRNSLILLEKHNPQTVYEVKICHVNSPTILTAETSLIVKMHGTYESLPISSIHSGATIQYLDSSGFQDSWITSIEELDEQIPVYHLVTGSNAIVNGLVIGCAK